MDKNYKFKILKKKDDVFLVLKSCKGQYINKTDYEYIRTHTIMGLVPMILEEKKSSFIIKYRCSGYISLEKYLTTQTVNKAAFYKLLKSFLETIRQVDKSLDRDRVVLNLKYVMVDTRLNTLNYIYIPIQNLDNGEKIKDFLQNLVLYPKAHFAQNEDTTYLKEYQNIIRNGINVSLIELEEFVNNLADSSDTDDLKLCRYCNLKFPPYQKYCSNCGNLLEKTGNNLNLHENQVAVKEKTGNNLNLHENQVAVKEKTRQNPEIQLQYENNSSIECYYLIREKTFEKYVISVDRVMVIGRKESADIVINDNKSIGREHAYIKEDKDGKVWIRDNSSTNGTFVDNKRIDSDWKQIFPDNRLKLSNEYFKIQVEKSIEEDDCLPETMEIRKCK